MCSEHNITLTEPGMLRLKPNNEKNKKLNDSKELSRRSSIKKNRFQGENNIVSSMDASIDVFTCFKQFGTSCKKYINPGQPNSVQTKQPPVRVLPKTIDRLNFNHDQGLDGIR